MRVKYYEVEAILDKCLFRNTVLYLIKWKNFAWKNATWEPANNLQGAKEMLMQFEIRQSNEFIAKPKQQQLLVRDKFKRRLKYLALFIQIQFQNQKNAL